MSVVGRDRNVLTNRKSKGSENMGYTAKQLVSIAEAEIGYHEKASNANLDSKTDNSGKGNYTKYSKDLFKAGYYNGNKQGFDWCDQFVDWCFFKLCGRNKDKAE